MGRRIVRVEQGGKALWAELIREGELERIYALKSQPESLKELINTRPSADLNYVLQATKEQYLNPVTAPCQILCQGKNYLDHLLETGTKPKNKSFNIFFTKAYSSLTAPSRSVKRPKGVRLLDYEIELALIIGKSINARTQITADNLHEYIVGMTIANDVSARDVQVPQGQWYKGKSFREFCPIGPILYWADPSERNFWNNLDLELRVNGELRQKSNTKMLMYEPLATLQEAASLMDFAPGDILLTGTPGGVAMKIPSGFWRDLGARFMSEKDRMARFLREQSESPRYLKDGDDVEGRIRSPEGKIDLGVQCWRVMP
jgi:2,4-didehydro-3-deoxy-L-rhamnonate hydrolase